MYWNVSAALLFFGQSHKMSCSHERINHMFVSLCFTGHHQLFPPAIAETYFWTFLWSINSFGITSACKWMNGFSGDLVFWDKGDRGAGLNSKIRSPPLPHKNLKSLSREGYLKRTEGKTWREHIVCVDKCVLWLTLSTVSVLDVWRGKQEPMTWVDGEEPELDIKQSHTHPYILNSICQISGWWWWHPPKHKRSEAALAVKMRVVNHWWCWSS